MRRLFVLFICCFASVKGTSEVRTLADPVFEPCISSTSWRSISHTPLKADENLRYVVHWGLVTGGYSTLSIQGIENINHRPAFHIVSEAHSVGLTDVLYTVRDHNDSWLDVDSLTSVRYEKNIHEGKYRIEQRVVMDQTCQRYSDSSYRIDKDRFEQQAGTMTVHAMDVLGSLYYVRTLPLEVGKSFTIDVLSNGKLWPLEVSVRKRETIKISAGKFDCWLIEPLLREPGIFISKGKKLEVWMTADEKRIPIRMRSEVVIGHVSADLIELPEH